MKLAGQSADVVMAAGDLLPDPPAGTGWVDVVVDAWVAVDVVDVALFVFLLFENSAKEMPTMAATMAAAMDDPPDGHAPLAGLLFRRQPRLTAGFLTLTLLGVHGATG